MSPDRQARTRLFGLSALAGAGLGAVALTGGTLVLYEAEGMLAASAGMVATLVAGLAVGLWVGAPVAEDAGAVDRSRWLASGVAVGLAGVFSTWWSVAAQGGGTRGALALLFLIGAPAYALASVLPALLVTAEREGEHEEEEAWGALGTITLGCLSGIGVGALLAGVLLLPLLGAAPLLLGLGAVLITPALRTGHEREEPSEHLLWEQESPFWTVRVTEVVYPRDRQPVRKLYVDEEEESGELARSGAPTLAYIAAAERWLSAASSPGLGYLFLGGGAYTLPRRVAEADSRARVDVVELDPEVTRAAYHFFGLRADHGIASLHGDARAWVDALDPERYDRIFLDVYDGREMLPYSLVTREAFRRMRRILRPEGQLGVNAIGVVGGEGSRRLWSVVRTLTEEFAVVGVYPHLGRDYSERQNVLLLASPNPEASLPERIGAFERWPAEEWPRQEDAVVFFDRFEAPGSVPKRVAR